MKIVLASHNPGKMKEMSAILAAFGVELVLQSDLGMHIEVEETGTTFRENALLKAQAVMKATRMPAISDDSGLMVDALNGAPGVYTARYGGEGLSDTERYRLLLSALTGQTNRAAHFYSCIACVFPTGEVLTAQGVCDGTIAFAPMGEDGFGYDPIFFVPKLRRSPGASGGRMALCRLGREEKQPLPALLREGAAFFFFTGNSADSQKCRIYGSRSGSGCQWNFRWNPSWRSAALYRPWCPR